VQVQMFWTPQSQKVEQISCSMDISLSLTYTIPTYCSAHMKLTIRNLQYGDFGNYRCISKNSLGETEGSIRVYGKCICIGDLSALVTANTQIHTHTTPCKAISFALCGTILPKAFTYRPGIHTTLYVHYRLSSRA